MRTLFALAVLLAGSTATARADELSPETLAAVKHATVYIRVETRNVSGSGSGFILSAKRGQAIVVTNNHVVVPTVEGAPRPVRGRADAKVTVVFESGTRQEWSAKAEVLALDPEHDLAILSVADVPEQAVAIDYESLPKLYETMPVYSFGFPFGSALSMTRGGPAITVGKASLSSLRSGEDGDVALVQFDGALNPGNSGGPVVDSKGRLVGVAVATLKDATSINFAVPRADVIRALEGRAGRCTLIPGRSADGGKIIHAEVPVVDPFGQVTSVTLHYLRPAKPLSQFGPDDKLSAHAGSQKVSLRIDKGVATADILADTDPDSPWSVQVEYVNSSPKPLFTPVRLARTARGPESAPQVAARPPERRQPPPARAVPHAGPARSTALSRDPKRAPDETDIVGGVFDPSFREVAPKGGVLVGFHVGYGGSASSPTIVSIRPRYLTPDGLRSGRMWGLDDRRQGSIHAKRGYAVGAITVHNSIPLLGIKVTFMRMKKDGTLDVNDAYDSDWLGTPGGDHCRRLGGDGSLVVGVSGRGNRRDITGLGLVLSTKDPNEADGEAK